MAARGRAHSRAPRQMPPFACTRPPRPHVPPRPPACTPPPRSAGVPQPWDPSPSPAAAPLHPSSTDTHAHCLILVRETFLTSSAVYICAFLRQRLEGMRAAAAARALAARAGRSRQGLRARARARPRPSGGAPARRAATTMGPPLPATSLTLGRALGSPAALCTLGVFQVGRTRRSARGGWETPPRARALRRGEGGRARAKEEEAPARARLAGRLAPPPA